MTITITLALLSVVILQALLPLWTVLRRAKWLSADDFAPKYKDKQWITTGFPLIFFLFFCISLGVTFSIDRVTETPTAPLVFYTYNLVVTMYGGFEMATGVTIWPSMRRRAFNEPAKFTADERVWRAGVMRLLLGLVTFWAAFSYWSL